MSRMVIGMAIGSGLLFVTLAAPATAQSPIEIRATAPEKPQQLRIVEPSEATRQSTRPREADFYREDVRVRHEPAFIEPFVGQTQGGTKYGLSGWTSPTTPVGSYVSQEPWARSGWPALGITVVWDSVPAASTPRVSNPR
ncbi:MAG TPA: hypothetical protein VKS62_05295 [Methylomirabilota bacterium]|jgi:hypothetical protein|nr:hypothetical protein [Methylomirabilota bacterium]